MKNKSNLDPYSTFIVIRKLKKDSKEPSTEFYYTLNDFIKKQERNYFRVYAKKIEIAIVFKTQTEFQGKLMFEVKEVKDSLLVIIILTIILGSVFATFGIFLYFVVTYFYNVIILKRYSMGFVDWVTGK